MNVFFDVDETLISFDWKLRPDVTDVFEQIIADGHTIYLWSGHGPRWEVVKQFGLHQYVTDCFSKPLENHHERLAVLKVPFAPDYVIDDYQSIVDAFGGTRVQAAVHPFEGDREMWRVYDEIKAFVARREAESAGSQDAEAERITP